MDTCSSAEMTGPLQDSTMPPAAVPPVPEGKPRPRWSVMIPAYNCASLLRKTLESVLAQDPGPGNMQIEVVDDCSTSDDPESVVREAGQGRVSFFRQPRNCGAIANFNTCIRRSTGHLVHILHGDDLVLPGFYKSVEEASESHPDVAFFSTRAFHINDSGEIDSLGTRYTGLETPTRDSSLLWYGNGILTPSVVVRRSFYERYGSFRTELVHTADWDMWVRAISSEGGLMLNQPLACYRFFAANDSSRLQRTAENARDCLRLGGVLAGRFPDFDPVLFRECVASLCRNQATSYRLKGDTEAARANLELWQELVPPAGRAKLLYRELTDVLRLHRHLWK